MQLLDWLIAVEAVGAMPVRHGGYIGVRHPERMTAPLWEALDRLEPELLRLLPGTPTPYQQREVRP